MLRKIQAISTVDAFDLIFVCVCVCVCVCRAYVVNRKYLYYCGDLHVSTFGYGVCVCVGGMCEICCLLDLGRKVGAYSLLRHMGM